MHDESERRSLRWLLWLPLLIGIVFGLWPEHDARPPVESFASHDEESPGDPGRDLLAATREQVGQPVDAPRMDYVPEPDADLEHPFAFSMRVRVLDRFALPVPEALVFVAPPGCGFSLWPEQTDEGGAVQLEWAGRTRVMEVQVAVIVWGVLQPIRSVPCEADQDVRLAVSVRGRRQQAEAVAAQANRTEQQRIDARMKVLGNRDGAGKLKKADELDVLCGRTQLLFRDVFSCTDCHDPGRVRSYSMLARAPEMSVGLHPFSSFHDLRTRRLRTKEAEERLEAANGEGAATRERERVRKRRGRVSGVVRDLDGSVVADVPVVWRDVNGNVLEQTRTRSSGRYVLKGLPMTMVELVAGGGRYGYARAAVQVVPRRVAKADFRLEQRSVISGEAIDAAGKPLRQWRVEVRHDPAEWVSWVETDREGEFVLSGVPGPGDCVLWAREQQAQLPIVYGVTALVDGAPVRLALNRDRPTRARLQLRAMLPDGFDHSAVDARVRQVDSGFVAIMRPFGFANALTLDLLPPGPYEVQVGAPGLGWSKAAEIMIDGRGVWDLGSIPLPAPGTVRIETVEATVSPFATTHAIYRRTAAVDVRMEERIEVVDGDPICTLPADHYVLLWRDDGVLRSREFDVTSRGETVLLVGPQ